MNGQSPWAGVWSLPRTCLTETPLDLLVEEESGPGLGLGKRPGPVVDLWEAPALKATILGLAMEGSEVPSGEESQWRGRARCGLPPDVRGGDADLSIVRDLGELSGNTSGSRVPGQAHPPCVLS